VYSNISTISVLLSWYRLCLRVSLTNTSWRVICCNGFFLHYSQHVTFLPFSLIYESAIEFQSIYNFSSNSSVFLHCRLHRVTLFLTWIVNHTMALFIGFPDPLIQNLSGPFTWISPQTVQVACVEFVVLSCSDFIETTKMGWFQGLFFQCSLL